MTRGVLLEATVRGVAVDARGKAKAALAVHAAIERAAFGMTTELLEESGQPGTGADIAIMADVEPFLVAADGDRAS